MSNTSTAPKHIHVIDGTPKEFEEKTCSFCHPDQQPQPQKTYPSIYRKGDTIVIMVSRGAMVTTTNFAKEKAMLLTISKMARGGDGKVILGADKKPVWQKETVRLSYNMAWQYTVELGKMINEVQARPDVPQRA